MTDPSSSTTQLEQPSSGSNVDSEQCDPVNFGIESKSSSKNNKSEEDALGMVVEISEEDYESVVTESPNIKTSDGSKGINLKVTNITADMLMLLKSKLIPELNNILISNTQPNLGIPSNIRIKNSSFLVKKSSSEHNSQVDSSQVHNNQVNNSLMQSSKGLKIDNFGNLSKQNLNALKFSFKMKNNSFLRELWVKEFENTKGLVLSQSQLSDLCIEDLTLDFEKWTDMIYYPGLSWLLEELNDKAILSYITKSVIITNYSFSYNHVKILMEEVKKDLKFRFENCEINLWGLYYECHIHHKLRFEFHNCTFIFDGSPINQLIYIQNELYQDMKCCESKNFELCLSNDTTNERYEISAKPEVNLNEENKEENKILDKGDKISINLKDEYFYETNAQREKEQISRNGLNNTFQTGQFQSQNKSQLQETAKFHE